MSRVKDETRKVYGRLTVLERAGSKNGKAAWLCRCECGNQTIVTGDALRTGNAMSCGCSHKEVMRRIGQANAIDITGQVFGKLTALKPIGSASYGGVLWECQCSCGNKHIVEFSNLKTGKVQSCGCLNSKGEQKIQQLLTQYNISYKTQYSPYNWKLSTNYKPFYDFAIFENEQLICLLEFHGEQHRKFYTNKSTWNNEDNFKKTQRRDKEKELLCQENKIPLYIIWYDEDINESLLKILNKENLTFNKNSDII